MKKRNKRAYDQVSLSIREIVFGMEDGFVSTLGAITGIAAGSESTFIVIMSGLVLIVVEALSMAAGTYLSSKATKKVRQAHGDGGGFEEHPIKAGVVMWFSYMFAGSVPLAPYFFLSPADALAPSVFFTVLMLFVLGGWSAKYTEAVWWKSGAEMLIVSLSAAVIGYVIGRLVANAFGVIVL